MNSNRATHRHQPNGQGGYTQLPDVANGLGGARSVAVSANGSVYAIVGPSGAVSVNHYDLQGGITGTTEPPSGAGGQANAHVFSGGGAGCQLNPAQSAFIAAPVTPPAGQALPQGLFRARLEGCDATLITLRITWPQSVVGYTKYGYASSSAGTRSYFTPSNLVVASNTVTFTVQDGQLGGDDWTVNGTIDDPSGPIAAAAIPTLGQWGLLLMGLLLAGLGGMAARRRA